MVKFSEKISTKEEIFEKSRLWFKISEISILVKINGKPQLNNSFENLDLVQNIKKIWILDKIFVSQRFCKKKLKISL